MPNASDSELLRNYDLYGSETAFTELVQRHIHFVYSVALRQVGIAAQAEEITQAVFIILARKASRLRAHAALEGWLYEPTRLTALSFLRGERRRHFREQETFMQSTQQAAAEDSTWRQLAPLLDEAMFRLRKKDRDAVVLRFFKDKNLREVAAALQVTEAAAQRRVLRAVEKLRKIFASRGVTLSTALIAGALVANSVSAAPVGMAKTISVIALTKGAAAGGSSLALVKGALKLMAWTKVKTAVVIGVGILLAAGTTTVMVEKAIPSTPAAMYEAIFAHPSSQSLNHLESAPPTLIFRPTQFPQKMGSGFWTPTGKSVAVNFPLDTLFGIAYGISPVYVVFPDDFNWGKTNYDILITLPAHQNEALQEELKRQFGLTAHQKTREAQVLLLEIADPAKLAAHETKGGGYRNFQAGAWPTRKQVFQDAGLAVVAEYVEVGKPVLDRTGSKKHYDFTFQWSEQKWPTIGAEMAAAESNWAGQLAQVGLELVPANLPAKMLVVEKAQ